MRSFALLPVVAAAVAAGLGCSSRSHEAGPTTGPEPGRPDGVAAPRPARPLDGARLDALAAVQVAGREVSVARRGAQDLAAIVVAPGGVRITVTASACLACAPMALAAWEGRRAELAALWAPADAAGDRLELAARSIAGHTVIAVDGRRTLDGEQRHTYQLHWNDGATQLAALCEATVAVGDAGAAPAADACAAEATTALAAYLAALAS